MNPVYSRFVYLFNPFVSCLLCVRCPPAIIRRIIPVHRNPVNYQIIGISIFECPLDKRN